MENQETLLTNELYESIMNKLTKEVVELKKSQSDAISSLQLKIEILKSLKKQLKETKKDIRMTRRKIHETKSSLSSINEQLNHKNHIVADLNYSFITEEDCYINPQEFLEDGAKKR